MRRFLSFRDFDWTLLGMVLALCTISVFEIYSATLHTKYAGFHTKQIYWIAGGLAAMFIFSKIDYHKLIDYVPWAYGVCLVALVAVLAVGQKVRCDPAYAVPILDGEREVATCARRDLDCLVVLRRCQNSWPHASHLVARRGCLPGAGVDSDAMEGSASGLYERCAVQRHF